MPRIKLVDVTSMDQIRKAANTEHSGEPLSFAVNDSNILFNLVKVHFPSSVSFDNVYFEGAMIRGISANREFSFNNCTFVNCKFSTKVDASFSGCIFTDCLFRAVTHIEDFNNCKITHCEFYHMSYEHGLSFINCEISNTVIEGCYVRTLSGCKLKDNKIFHSGLALACSTIKVEADVNYLSQLAYHICFAKSNDPDIIEAQKALVGLANKCYLINMGHVQPIDLLRISSHSQQEDNEE